MNRTPALKFTVCADFKGLQRKISNGVIKIRQILFYNLVDQFTSHTPLQLTVLETVIMPCNRLRKTSNTFYITIILTAQEALPIKFC